MGGAIIDIRHKGNGTSGKYTYKKDQGDDIEVTETKDAQKYPGYKRCTHRPKDDKEISQVKSLEKDCPNLSPNGCKSISVYFWLLDSTHEQPLVVQFDDRDEWYVDKFSQKWEMRQDINEVNLLNVLDEESCWKNAAHCVDLFNRDTAGYTCNSCNKKDVKVERSDVEDKYSKIRHTLTEGHNGYGNGRGGNDANGIVDNTISRVSYNGIPQHGIEAKKNVKELVTFCYPVYSGTPLLIKYDDKWYVKEDYDGTDWVKVKEAPASEDDTPNIMKILQKFDAYTTSSSNTAVIAGGIVGGIIGICLLGLAAWKLSTGLKSSV